MNRSLWQSLSRSARPTTQPRTLLLIQRAELVVVDELGFSALDSVAANHLFRLVAAAYETRSLVLTSNWAFELWTDFLPDATSATAILDRLLHHCEVVVLDGPSFRLREAKAPRKPAP